MNDNVKESILEALHMISHVRSDLDFLILVVRNGDIELSDGAAIDLLQSLRSVEVNLEEALGHMQFDETEIVEVPDKSN